MTLEHLMPFIYIGLLIGAASSFLNYRLQRQWFKETKEVGSDGNTGDLIVSLKAQIWQLRKELAGK